MAADFLNYIYRLVLRLVVYTHHHLPQKPHAYELYADDDQQDAKKQKRPAPDIFAENQFLEAEIELDKNP